MSIVRGVDAVFATGGQAYSYFVPEGDDPVEGDLIVTSVGWVSGDDSFIGRSRIDDVKVAKIVHVSPVAGPKATRFYLQLLSKDDLMEKNRANSMLAEMLKRKAEARKALDKLVAEADKSEMYVKLAATNPEAAELLKIINQ